MNLIRRIFAHDSTRAFLIVIAWAAACAITEQICALFGAGSTP